MLNANLCQADFYKLRKSDQNGFKKVRVVTVPAGTLLFKMTKGVAAAGQYGVTPWWSSVKPFLEDKDGALGRLRQAQANGIDMTAMVRFMSCVCKVKLMQLKEKQAGFMVPDVLGGPEAWQMYIPNLREQDIKRQAVISGHDMAALGMALGF